MYVQIKYFVVKKYIYKRRNIYFCVVKMGRKKSTVLYGLTYTKLKNDCSMNESENYCRCCVSYVTFLHIYLQLCVCVCLRINI